MLNEKETIENYMNKIANYEVDLDKIGSNIKECIRLLKVDGEDTKTKVSEILNNTLKSILEPYGVKAL